MTRQRIVALLAAGAVVVPATALAATTPQGPPDEVVERALGAAAEARGLALGLTKDVAEQGTPRGQGSEAFVERHEALAEKHAEHGNAGAVHAALADGRSPSTADKPKGNGGTPPGQAKKGDGEALRGARARFEEGWPGRGLGRGSGGGDDGA